MGQIILTWKAEMMDIETRILLIEDNPDDARFISEILYKEGFGSNNVVWVENIAAGMTQLENGRYDIILVGITSSGSFETGEVQKVVVSNPAIPVIILSGENYEDATEQVVRTGATDYLLKEKIDGFILPRVIKYAIGHKKFETERLDDQAGLLSKILDILPVGLWIMDKEGTIVHGNPASRKIWAGARYVGPDLFGEYRGWWLDTGELIRPEEWAAVRAISRKETSLNEEIEIECFDGTRKIILNSAIPVINNEGEIEAAIVLNEDITKRKLAEKEVRKLTRAVEQSPSAIIITDAEGKIEFVNRQFTRLTQYTQEEVKGKNPRIFNPGHASREEFETMWATLQAGNTWKAESQNRKKDGTVFCEDVIISPLLDDSSNICNYILIIEDITDKKKNHEALIIAKEKAEESDRLKAAFLNNISHEIRTPMNAIVGFSGLLNTPGLDPGNIKAYTEIIIRSGDQLVSIIDDIVSIATIEAGQEQINEQETDLNSICRLVYEQFFMIAREKNIALNFNASVSGADANILTDKTKLMEVLANLVDNAVKFTEKGSVDFGFQFKGNIIEFYVKDTGIGISPEMHMVIFKRFRKVDHGNNYLYGGSGLGLSISKAYVELLGGKIWLTSSPGKGSTFCFSVYLKKAVHLKQADQSTADVTQRKREIAGTILIVEDEDFNFMFLEEILAKEGFQIIRAVNGADAVEICKSNPHISLVLMDIKMPVMNGHEATRQIRELRPGLPIIAQTAYSRGPDFDKALKNGCIDLISKPFTKDMLISKISEHIRSS